MKKSKYIFAVNKGSNTICYNTFSNSFIVISTNSYLLFRDSPIEDFQKKCPNIFKTFTEIGFIIKEDIDETNILQSRHKMSVFHDQNLSLTILPTIDCNLSCWYCFENHKKSQMSEEIQKRIITFIKNEYEKKEIKNINLDFFGGEPLLYFDSIVYPLSLKIKEISENYKFNISTFFTTNATLITDEMAEKLASINPDFQITLDGDQSRHDKIRYYKNDFSGSYNDIINNIHTLFKKIPKAKFNIRINYDDKTLLNIENILEDLYDLDKTRMTLHFEKVWQAPKKELNTSLVEAFNLASLNGFHSTYLNWRPCTLSCKTDKLKQLAINYDGNVFKCTGRDFTEENSEGYLNKEGEIIWKKGKPEQRFKKSAFDYQNCLNCIMLPICMGPCSQKILEYDNDISRVCMFNALEMSIENYIELLYTNRALQQQL